VPADEWLRKCDTRRKLVDRHGAVLGKEADDSQARLVAERPIDGSQAAEISLGIGLGGEGHLVVLLYQMPIYINGGL